MAIGIDDPVYSLSDNSISSAAGSGPRVLADDGIHSYPQTTGYSHSTVQCPKCPETFTDGSDFKSHMSDIHGTEFPFVCSICGKGYLSSSGLYRHIRVHKGKLTFCTLCNSKFTQSCSFKRHLITIHNLVPCTYCKALFQFGVEYNNHKQQCGKPSFNNRLSQT